MMSLPESKLSADKILASIKKFEFIAEVLITSRYPNDTDIFQRFLIVVEAIKFYYRLKKFMNTNVFIDDLPAETAKFPQLIKMPMEFKGERQEMEKLLEQVKNKAHENYEHNGGMYETTSTNKKISLRSNYPIPSELALTKLTKLQTLGELLYLIRPLIYITCFWIYGTKSYKSWTISLIIDLCRILLQRNIKARSMEEKVELDNRNSEMLMKMLFRNPFYEAIFKTKIVIPILRKLFKPEGWITRIIMYILEMRSSVTLTI